MREKLRAEQRTESLKTLEGWETEPARDAIRKSFKFKNFAQAWAFMSRAAELAEEMDHHPEWSNVYNRVDVVLTTHSAGGVTALDIKMAQAMNEFAKL